MSEKSLFVGDNLVTHIQFCYVMHVSPDTRPVQEVPWGMVMLQHFLACLPELQQVNLENDLNGYGSQVRGVDG